MQSNTHTTRNTLKNADFHKLFTQQLGWDHQIPPATLSYTPENTQYTLTSIAQKRGMTVFECSQKHIPDYPTRQKIRRYVQKACHEHIIIYTDTQKTTHIWQWTKHDPGKPDASREHRYHITQPGDSLLQKLQTITFTLAEEERLTLTHVTNRVRAGFNVERITRKFYDRFKKEHNTFLTFIKGLPNTETQRWYASVMLNRLMFIYFIQKKEFLNSDTDYLRTHLTHSQHTAQDQYYKTFLHTLFFQGFATRQTDRTPDTNDCLGKIPYLNGGIFQHHPIEHRYGDDITIPDAAFERLFNFFEEYQWHLDDRPLRNDNEINPDVLGYIFEKYINQKQMGAYYTQEDITEYISKNTIIPFLFDAARKSCPTAFEGEANVWQLLQTDPDRYLYRAVRHGTDRALPPDIALGLDEPAHRTEWNTLAPQHYALPAEIWREVIARRQHYQAVQAKLQTGEIDTLDALITYNLNIRQFAQDVIENCEDPDLLRALWKSLTQMSILDPTCGSGAFLFAALNILEPLYAACLDRMQAFLDDLQGTQPPPHSKRFRDFRELLKQIDRHPNRCYFILKSIIVNNLCGVDIMEEAIEICKLRLFLKMVAQIETADQLEPLPDIDFNIQAGNTLIGYATYEAVEHAVTGKLDFDNTMTRIKERAEDVNQLFTLFRQQQTELGGTVTPEDKQALQNRLKELENELNQYLSGEYGVAPDDAEAHGRWLASHKPFHWFIAFYGILKKGGFDVIIGNPPYVEYRKVKKEYIIKGYETENCGNLYAFVTERSLELLNNYGSFGFIIPIGIICNKRMEILQKILTQLSKSVWLSNFSERPSKLFMGADVLLTILLSRMGQKDKCTPNTTKFIKWTSSERPHLFNSITYHSCHKKVKPHVISKIYANNEARILEKLSSEIGLRSHLLKQPSKYPIYYRISGGRYWKIFTNFQPTFILNGEKSASSSENCLYLDTSMSRDTVISVLSSSLFYWYYILTTDCRSLSTSDLYEFPINLKQLSARHTTELKSLCKQLMTDYRENSQLKEKISSRTGHIVYQEFYLRLSKPIIDKIDQVLAQHYGFTDEELDFIINYDIKYRMGLGRGQIPS